MSNYNIVPYNNDTQLVPKDNPTLNGIYPVEYWRVTAQNISEIKYDQVFSQIKEGINYVIQITGPNNTAANQKTTTTFSVSASLGGLTEKFAYQWQKQESSGGDWFNLATASGVSYTTPMLVYGPDNNDLYRCIVTDLTGAAVNSPLTSPSAVLSINPAIISAALPEFITVNESTTASMSVSPTISNLAGPTFSYQWRKQESSGGSFSNISGATLASYTTPTISFANDYNDKYLCVISEPYSQNSPYTTNQLYLNVRRVITITSQPTAAASYVAGITATFTVTATITSDVITYQWQKKLFNDLTFSDISGASSPSYTTPTLTLNDGGTLYRCVLTNAYADPKITNELIVIIGTADLQISPAVGGKNYWTFSSDGVLVLDPNNSTTYTITALGNKTIQHKLWGQGTCNATGGYAAGTISSSLGNTYTVKLNAGGGSCGIRYGGTGCWPGGGYAGIFNGTSPNQGNAVLIAGGAGGGGANTGQSCSRRGGDGGGSSGTSGETCDNSQIGSTGGGGGTSSSGGSAGAPTSTGGVYYRLDSSQNVSFTVTESSGYFLRLNIQGIKNFPENNSPNPENIYVNAGTYFVTASSDEAGNATVRIDPTNPQRVQANDGGGSWDDIEVLASAGSFTSNAPATAGSALLGGTGGDGVINSNPNAAGGGGGGGGYFGGGGGGGGNDFGNGTRDSSGGGGGSGFVAGSVINGSTSTFTNSSDINRGGAGSANSNSRIVLEMPMVSFSSQPSSTSVVENSTATFSATVSIPTVDLNSVAWSPAVTVNYQWQSFVSGSWSNISGANSSSYSVTATSEKNGTNYRLIVTSNYGNTLISNTATLTILTPTYSISPANSSVNEGSSVTITVNTTNVLNGTVLYWRVGSTTITPTYTLTQNVSPYSSSVTINNNSGSFNINATADSLTESETQSFFVQLYKESTYTTLLSTTSTITINDTSTTPSAPSGTFTASPTSINSGSSSTLSWYISNVTSITIDQEVNDPSIPAGITINSETRTVSPTSTTTYTLSASGPGGSLTLYATVTVASLKTITASLTYAGNYTQSNGINYDYFFVSITRTTEEVPLSFAYSVTFSGGPIDSYYGNSPTGTFTGGNGSASIAIPNPHYAGGVNLTITCPGYNNFNASLYIANTY